MLSPLPSQPLVSIVTPSFQQARFLEETLRSVLGQDYPRLEYLALDGGSTDGSLEILRRHADRLAYWTSAPDRGQADAIDRGLRRTKGEIVAWLNSDDLYCEGTVRKAVRALQDHPEAGMAYADGWMVDQQGTLLDVHRYRQYAALDLLRFDVLLQPTVFLRREALAAAGWLNHEYQLIFDHELWIRVAELFPIIHIPEVWAVERTHAHAKTIAQAASFVEEAEQLLTRVGAHDRWSGLKPEARRSTLASMHCFACRRLIDAGEYGEALDRFWRTMRLDARVAARYWYKGVQAMLGRAGLAGAFLTYRDLRRRVSRPAQRVVVGEHGARLAPILGPDVHKEVRA